MHKIMHVITIVAVATAFQTLANETQLPPFLPSYYRPAFNCSGESLGVVGHKTTNDTSRYMYSTKSGSLALSIESIRCDTPRRTAIFGNLQRYLNQQISSNQGCFAELTATEMHAEVVLTNVAQTVFVLSLPASIQVWTYMRAPTNRAPLGVDFKNILGWANRQRYEEALQNGNVDMGCWQASIHDYARESLNSGKKEAALIVLKNLLATSPFDYDAHFLFMDNTPSAASASNSAKKVFANAEDQNQIEKAARVLGATPRSIDRLTPLSHNEAGLQVILMPLPPCNPWILDEVAKVYERITDIPVKIRRTNYEWIWGTPDRIPDQRHIQGLLVRFTNHNIDFAGWTKEHYQNALADAVKSEDALSKFWVHDLIDNIEKEPGQFCVDSHLHRLSESLKNYRSNDRRTMYVAITEANIYSGDNNYLFSVATTNQESAASILSYYMMLGRTLHAEFDSRQRLTERIAKELVPASLKQLGIPRSTDPTCPYSYSSGVERLDQKTLTLSDEVKEALNKLRDPPPEARIP